MFPWDDHSTREILRRLSKLEDIMSTGLTALQAAIGELNTKVVAIDADVKKLLANATSGPGPGQVIVNQADIDALTASVAAATTTLTADDTAVNPPPPAAG
jgi:hypothetical protein